MVQQGFTGRLARAITQAMRFPAHLVPATLIQRYKRFLADVTLEDGRVVTAHCANPGSMIGLKKPGSRVWLSPAGPGRKLSWSLELIEVDGFLVAINTNNPNRLARDAIEAGLIEGLTGWQTLTPEVRYGAENSRVDLLLEGADGARSFVEVKNCHLMRTPGFAEFPDSVTSRGAKHLRELAAMVSQGHRAVMLFIVQRPDCTHFGFAADLDPAYAAAARTARDAGVDFLCYDCEVGLDGVLVRAALPIQF
jgi:sugar fermentation stimulation protein A